MNREELDMLVKQALFAYSNELLIDVGESICRGETHRAVVKIHDRADALDLFRSDAKRAAVVDVLLKEMNS